MVSIQKIYFGKKYIKKGLQIGIILFPNTKCVAEKRT